MIRLKSEDEPQRLMSSAFLVTDYFAMESRTRQVPVKWRARCRTMRRLYRRLAEAQARAGIDASAERFLDRPGAYPTLRLVGMEA